LKCPDCGNIVPVDAKFCAYCASRLQQGHGHKEKIYGFIGATLGTCMGFGVGYGAGLLGATVKSVRFPESAAFVNVLMLIIAAVLTGVNTKRWLAALVFFLVGGPCVGVAIAVGGDFNWEDFLEFGSHFFPLVLVIIPFATLGAINGYWRGRLKGKKA
jgi:hypothetical protein